MSRWFLIAIFGLALTACTGCETAPDASATSGSASTEASQHRDATCTAAIAGCSETCPQANALAASEAEEGLVDDEAAFTCPETSRQDCVNAQSAAVEECPHPGSHPGCPVLGEEGIHPANEGCSKACAARADQGAAATIVGCAGTAGPDTEHDSDAK
jgi:hypothetical protein